MQAHRHRSLAALGSVAAAVALTACNPADTADATHDAARAAAAAMDDAIITARIKSGLMQDGLLGAMDIEVDTVGGHVLLLGTVADAAARERAVRLARAVAGVVAVEQHLRVAPTT